MHTRKNKNLPNDSIQCRSNDLTSLPFRIPHLLNSLSKQFSCRARAQENLCIRYSNRSFHMGWMPNKPPYSTHTHTLNSSLIRFIIISHAYSMHVFIRTARHSYVCQIISHSPSLPLSLSHTFAVSIGSPCICRIVERNFLARYVAQV